MPSYLPCSLKAALKKFLSGHIPCIKGIDIKYENTFLFLFFGQEVLYPLLPFLKNNFSKYFNHLFTLKILKMNMKNLFLFVILSAMIIGCSKNETQQELQVEQRLTTIQLPTLAGVDFDRPEVPIYLGDTSVESRGITTVAPGTNQLQAIINNAKNNETIKLLAGTHTEDVTLVINHKIKLIGEPGAVLSLGDFIGLLVTTANGTKISDLEIENNGGSVIGIGVENSDHVEIKDNVMSGFDWSIALEQANHAKVKSNSIVGAGAGVGITVVNGDFVHISGNNVSVGVFGIWACDRKGTCINNTTTNNLMGVILCKVPEGSLPLGTGTGGSEFPGNEWHIINNTSTDNVWGYIAVDGAHDNILSNNEGGNNAIDMELAQSTNNFFGFFTPTSANNTVNIGGGNITVIDCGVDNVVNGGTPLPGPCLD